MFDARGLLHRLTSAVRAGIPSAESAMTEPQEQVARHAPRKTTVPMPSHWFRSAALLDVRGLQVAATEHANAARLLDGISLSITRGEAIGLVGDADSGAIEIAQCIAGVLPAPAIIRSGSILFDGAELVGLPQRAFSRLRHTTIAFLPRDPLATLDSTATVGAHLTAPLRSRLGLSKTAAYGRALALLQQAGVERPEHAFTSYPHELSATLAQRVHIANALAIHPSLLVAFDPTQTLDAADSADILELLRALQHELGMTMIIVTGSVSAAALACHRVAILRAGAVVEYNSVAALFDSPKHSYTRELLHAAQNEEPTAAAL